MDRGAWKAAVHGVAMSWTWLSDFTFNFHFHALEGEMATHSIILAWRIPGMGEPGGLPSMELHRVGHDWSDLAAAAAATQYCKAIILQLRINKAKKKKLWEYYEQLGFPGGSDGKKSACNVGNSGSIPESGRSPGEENGNPLQ